MKKTITAIAIALALAAGIGCGPSDADQQADKDYWHKRNMEMKEQTNRMEEEHDGMTLKIVKLSQGEAAANTMDQCMGRGGYKMINNGPGAWAGDASHANLSNRRKAECDAIVKTQNRIESKRDAQEKAEEKRKDDAYDKVHPAKETK